MSTPRRTRVDRRLVDGSGTCVAMTRPPAGGRFRDLRCDDGRRLANNARRPILIAASRHRSEHLWRGRRWFELAARAVVLGENGATADRTSDPHRGSNMAATRPRKVVNCQAGSECRCKAAPDERPVVGAGRLSTAIFARAAARQPWLKGAPGRDWELQAEIEEMPARWPTAESTTQRLLVAGSRRFGVDRLISHAERVGGAGSDRISRIGSSIGA
jgi:hypothetical protein